LNKFRKILGAAIALSLLVGCDELMPRSSSASEPVSSVEVARAYTRQESVIAEQIKTRTPLYLHDRNSCFSGQSRSYCTRAKTELQQLMLLEGEVHSLSLNETQDSRVSDHERAKAKQTAVKIESLIAQQKKLEINWSPQVLND
jgi:hypothetical protein